MIIEKILKSIKTSIAIKINLFILIPLIISIFGISLFHYFYERNFSAQREIDSFKFFSAEIASQIDDYILSYKNIVQHLSVMPKFQSLLKDYKTNPKALEELNSILDSNAALSPDYYAINLMNKEGLCVASSNRSFIGHDYSMRHYFKKAILGLPNSSDWLIGIVSQVPGIFFSTPVYQGKEIIGVLSLRIKTDRIIQIMNFKKDFHLNVYLISEMGIMLHHTDPSLEYHSLMPLTPEQLQRMTLEQQFGEKKIESLNLKELQKNHFKALAESQPVVFNYPFNGETKIAALSRLHSQNWVVGVSKNHSEIYASSHLILLFAILVGLFFLIIAFAGGYHLSKKISVPLHQLADSANSFSKGKITERIEIKKQDEIGKLAASFNAMADAIQEYTETLENKIAERTAELEKSNSAKDKMFSLVAHDLIGPFGTNLSLLKLLIKEYNGFNHQEILEYLNLLLNNSENTFALMENILNWARSQRNNIVFSPIKINLNQFIEEVILILKSLAENKKITIEHIKKQDIFVFADWNMLHTILRNLITNAIKFTSGGGKISIQAVLKARTAFISVDDNGIGMTEEKARDIFKIGVKTSQLGTAGEKGTGLGLILCKEFVEKNGGKIDFFSKPGKGTSFVFTLPACED